MVGKRPRRRPAIPADPFYEAKQVDNSRLVKQADPLERRAQFKLVWFSLLLLAVVLAAACQRFALIRTGYGIEQLKSQREQLLEANRQLQLEEARLRDPSRIHDFARNRLGMMLPGPGQVVYLEKPSGDLGGTAVARNTGAKF
jgi:cell division protein FtsL